MKVNAIRIHRTGGPEVMHYEAVELPAPGPGQALVRHKAIGINFIDTYHRSGLYPLPVMPSGLGQEAAGVVEAVGSGVTAVAVGDRVAYAPGPVGAYSEAHLIPADRLVKLPDDIDERTAAAMMLQGMTVEYLIHRTFAVHKGMTVLWHAAAGGVGSIASQWLAHLGVTVIGTVGNSAKAKLAREHGCAHVIDYTHEDFVARVKEITGGRGVDVAYDSVGKSTLMGSLHCVKRRGLAVSFGNASGAPDPLDPLVLSNLGSLYLTRPKLGDYTATREELLLSAERLFEVVRNGAVKINIGRAWRLAEAAEAHRALEARETTGSVILVP